MESREEGNIKKVGEPLCVHCMVSRRFTGDELQRLTTTQIGLR